MEVIGAQARARGEGGELGRLLGLIDPLARTANRLDFRIGSKAALAAPKSDFSFTPESGLRADIGPCPFRATSGLVRRSKHDDYRSPCCRSKPACGAIPVFLIMT